MSTTLTAAAIARRMHEQTFTHDGDLGVLDEFVAEDFLDHTAPPGFPSGRAGLRILAEHWRAAIPDIRTVVEDVVADGEYVAVAWRGTGTHLGELMGIPATGRAGGTTGVVIVRVLDGQVVERWGNSDDLGLMRTLGVIR